MTWRPPVCWQPQHKPTPPKLNPEQWDESTISLRTDLWLHDYADGRAPCYCSECRGELRDPVTRRLIDIDQPEPTTPVIPDDLASSAV